MIDGWDDGWSDGCIDGLTDGWDDARSEGCIDGLIDGRAVSCAIAKIGDLLKLSDTSMAHMIHNSSERRDGCTSVKHFCTFVIDEHFLMIDAGNDILVLMEDVCVQNEQWIDLMLCYSNCSTTTMFFGC